MSIASVKPSRPYKPKIATPKSANSPTVSNRIRELRERRGMSQPELAAIAKVGQATLSRVERGLVGLTMEVLARLSIALDVEPGALLGAVVCRDMTITPASHPDCELCKFRRELSRKKGAPQ